MSASSHPRRARPGEGGRDRPGSAGSSSVKARAAVGHVTTLRPPAAMELTPHSITRDLRTPPQGEDPVIGGPLLLLPD